MSAHEPAIRAGHDPIASHAIRTTSDWFDAFQALLARQRETAGRLRQLAARQASVISAGYGEALLVILGERQQAIDELLRSQAELAPFIPEMNQRLAALPAARQAEVRGALDDIAAALDEVMRGDSRDQQAITAQRSATRDELGALTVGRTARDAYVKPGTQHSRFADRHG